MTTHLTGYNADFDLDDYGPDEPPESPAMKTISIYPATGQDIESRRICVTVDVGEESEESFWVDTVVCDGYVEVVTRDERVVLETPDSVSAGDRDGNTWGWD